MSKEKLAAFESYRAHDAFHPPSARVVSFWVFLGVVIFLLILLLNKLDQLCLSGLRFVPHIVVLYILSCIFRLWIQCEWALWTAWRRGLNFEERGLFKASREEEIAKLRKKLESNGPCPILPHGSPKVLCITGYGGGGHEATLNGVRAVMAEAGFKPTIMDVPVGFFVETSEKNLLWLIFGVTGEQLYNWGLRQGAFLAFAVAWSTSYLQHWALCFDQILGASMKLLGLDLGDEAAKLCCRVWTETAPDMICNFTTGTSNFMAKGLRRAGLSHIPVVLIISDFEGVGAHSWIESRGDNVVCGTSLCRQQALNMGVPPDQVFQTSGMILRPAFYEAVDISPDRGAALRRLGLDPGRRTCLVFWGGVGSGKVVEAGRAVLAAREPLNLIFLCGRNTQLQEQLQQMAWPVKVLIEGYTSNVSFYMQVSDMIVCKPGPGVASEAALLGLPILVEWSAFTLPQEVAVCKWVVSRGLGLGFSRMGQLAALVDRVCSLLGPFDTARQLRPIPIAREGMTGVDMNPADNKAVFEVPSILHGLLVARYGPGSGGRAKAD